MFRSLAQARPPSVRTDWIAYARLRSRYAPRVEAGEFDEAELYAALARSGARVLVIGRQAMIIHGVPVLTSDYDLWVHIEEVGKLNDALAVIDLIPNRAPEEARQRGRYVIEGHQHVGDAREGPARHPAPRSASTCAREALNVHAG